MGTAVFQTIVKCVMVQAVVQSAVLAVRHWVPVSFTMSQLAVKCTVIKVIMVSSVIVVSDAVEIVSRRSRNAKESQDCQCADG